MEEKDPDLHSDFFVVSEAGSKEVNGVYKNLDGNSNDNTLNYKMTNKEGRTFKLYRSPSEDLSVRYWIIEERNQDYYYLAFSDKKIPPETDWTPYVSGKARPPEVMKVSREVEYELRRRIENYDSFSTLDLIDQYGSYCETPALKKLYRVLWEEQSPETQQATKDAAQALSRAKKKKIPTIKQKITITVQLGVGPSDVTAAQSFELMVNADTPVHFLKENIAKKLGNDTGKDLELMFNGHKILSREARINKLGIVKGGTIIALGVKKEAPRTKPAAGGQSGLRKSALPPLDEVEDQPVSPDQGSSVRDIDITPQSKKSCVIQ